MTAIRRAWTPQSIRLVQLAVTLLAALYMLLIGGTFDATLRFRVQLLNFVAAGALALLWLAVRLLQRQAWRRTGVELPLLLFIGVQWVALLASAQPRLGLEWAAGVVAWGAAFCILYDLLVSGWPREYIANALLLVAAIVSADGIWSAVTWYAGWVRLGEWPPVTFRYNGLLGHANLTACVLNLLLPLAVVRAGSGGTRARLAFGSLAAAMLVTEFFTSSRAGWLAGGTAMLTLGALLAYRHGGLAWLRAAGDRWGQLGWILKAASVAGVVIAAGAGAWLLSKQAQGITHGPLLAARQPFWSVAWDLFLKRPLTGSGPDLYGWFYTRYASVPPEFFAPHAHSVPVQVMSGSGLLGLAGLLILVGYAGWQLWRGWLAAGRPVETAALLAGLVSVALHQLFDDLFGWPILPFLVVVVVALALASVSGAEARRKARPIWMLPVLLVPISIFGFALRASNWNAAGLQLAGPGNWQAAGAAFEHAGHLDPGVTLYWEEAAYAYTSAGEVQTALPLWQRAAQDDPNWALLPATLGALKQDLGAAQAARKLAPGSYLFALNAGAIAEAQGNTAAAQEAYRSALSLKPTIAEALYWQQNPLRLSIIKGWRSGLPATSSALDKGWAALASGAPDQAVGWFRKAAADDPNSLAPELGLGKAYLTLGDLNVAQRVVQAGLELPVTSLEETLPLHLLAGDVADARGDRAGAISEYATVFSGIADYDIDGPGSYGDPIRSRQVFHREALPGELVQQLPRADVTADMDRRLAKLSQWYRADGQTGLACWVLQRVHQEAPDSVSGALYQLECPAASH